MHPRRSLPLLALLLLPAALPAADPKEDTSFGDRLRDTYFRLQVRQIAEANLADVKDLADWKKKRPELRRQFLDMVGLWPMPEHTPLKPVITGTLETDDFTVENLHFQSVPGLYVSANLYLPRNAKQPAPAVLYVCGHARVKEDGVSYGNKVAYQHHGAWFARNGYVCLIVDTLQLGEIEGLHHGTHNLGMWWWQARGYTPAGIECWNAIRALDYLETRKEVDPKRLGVTGRSGGGATSWWLAAADDRPHSIIPVAGIADLWAHVVAGDTPRFQDGVISGHCDCMYFVNTYRWDFTTVLALCAPRPLMLGNSDADGIFPVAGYKRMVPGAKRIYDLYGAGDRFTLLETEGPHKDTPELRAGAFAWMNRWLKDETGEISDPEPKRFTPQELQVFKERPEDAINAIVHERFIRPASPELPEKDVAKWWEEKVSEWKTELRTRSFGGWPKEPPPLNARLAGEVKQDGLRLRGYDFVSEEGVPLRAWVITPEGDEKLTRVICGVSDEDRWDKFVRLLGPACKEVLYGGGNKPPAAYPEQDRKTFEGLRDFLTREKAGAAIVAPRGVGPTRWSEISPATGKPAGEHIHRRFALIGQTLEGQQVHDVRRGLACLRAVPGLEGVPVEMHGRGRMAGVALYAALFDPGVASLEFWDLPASHREGPIFLNVLRTLDTPQAVALAFPRPVTLHVGKDGAEAWQWPLKLQEGLGKEYLKVVEEEKE